MTCPAPPEPPPDVIRTCVERFVEWLDAHGETSYDHQSFFAGSLGRAAKGFYYRHKAIGAIAVAPMIACEAVAPAARRLFWKRQRFPIADAHYASGFAFLAKVTDDPALYARAVHFLRVLIATRSLASSQYAWGYPFDWVTLQGTFTAGTPMITTLPYVYEAFEQVYRLDSDDNWRVIMRSIADHALNEYREHATRSGAASCSYTPGPHDQGGVVNASAYRAFLLTKAAHDFGDARYERSAHRNLLFVLQSQNQDGSWFYAMDRRRTFIDHFHTCFVLKALAKIHMLTRDPDCAAAITHGVNYYVSHLFDENRLPKPFSRRPRLTVYLRELYDYAEALNLGMLLRGRFPDLDANRAAVLTDLMKRWRRSNGSFRSRELMLGWDNVPMHRWAQAQIFRSLCFFIHENAAARSATAN
jgi:hypothetical protein